MKKFIIITLTLAAFAACSYLCIIKKTESDTPQTTAYSTESISFEPLNVSRKIILDPKNTESPYMNIDISLFVPHCADKTICKSIEECIVNDVFGYENLTIQQAVDSLIKKSETLYLTDEMYNYYLESEYPGVFEWYETIDCSLAIGYNGTICYTAKSVSYYGGAHPLYHTEVMSINPENGKRYTLDDIFKANTKKILEKRLISRLAYNNNITTVEELEEIGYFIFTFNQFFVTENFELRKDGIAFIYNAYEIAPYSMGESVITLGYDEIKDILK